MKRFVSAFALMLFAAVALGAQVPVKAPAATASAAPAVPSIDDLETSWLQIVALSEQLAYAQCQQLETVQKFNATRNDVVKRLEERHPGYTLDWAKGALVAKGK